jgi:hypothetical protein
VKLYFGLTPFLFHGGSHGCEEEEKEEEKEIARQ